MFDSLGSARYLSCVQASEVVVGNSSSGIIEAPFLQTPTVDIGIRQQGRLRGQSVIHSAADKEAIKDAIRAARLIRDKKAFSSTPYRSEGAAKQILETLKKARPQQVKSFFDIDFDI